MVCRPPKALAVWRFNQCHRATLRQWIIRMTPSSALSLAAITSLVFACAFSGVARPVPAPTPDLPRVAITRVAVDAAAGREVSGPVMVAAHAALMQNFVDAILDGSPLIAPGEEGIHSVELANVMLYSSLLGETVELPMNSAAAASVRP